MVEEWRVIPGFAPYEASSLGNIRNAAGRVMVGTPNDEGYLRISLWIGRRRICDYVHRLVCRTFHGQPPPEAHADHYPDKARSNNREVNLRWLSPVENRALRDFCCGEEHPVSVLTIPAVLAIRASDESTAILAQRYGVAPRTVRDARKRETWKHV